MKLSDFDYNLPKKLIAQYPTKKRDESRLMVLHRDTGKIEHRIFKDIVGYLNKDDLVVLNNTKVALSRLVGRKETGGKVEALVLRLKGQRDKESETKRVRESKGQTRDEYEVLLKPSRRYQLGTKIVFGEGRLNAEITRIENGRRFLRFDCNGDFEKLLYKIAKVPLPPYIKRESDEYDKERYQTVYASKTGAIAAPTAGLHWTKDILRQISEKGVDVEYVTLHVGYGTFKPVRCEDIKRHRMEEEYFEVEDKVVQRLEKNSGRKIAVGTTVCRVLETIYSNSFLLKQESKTIMDSRLPKNDIRTWTDLFIYPPYRFKAVDALLTNFHLPRTTLLMLVGAFCGRELLFKAYNEAVRERYRFYSYGDAMLVL